MRHFIAKYGESWAFKNLLTEFEKANDVVKLSELKKGECFCAPFRTGISFKLSDGNLFFNLHGYTEYPHTVEHEDPNAIVVRKKDLVWDFERNTFTML